MSCMLRPHGICDVGTAAYHTITSAIYIYICSAEVPESGDCSLRFLSVSQSNVQEYSPGMVLLLQMSPLPLLMLNVVG